MKYKSLFLMVVILSVLSMSVMAVDHLSLKQMSKSDLLKNQTISLLAFSDLRQGMYVTEGPRATVFNLSELNMTFKGFIVLPTGELELYDLFKSKYYRVGTISGNITKKAVYNVNTWDSFVVKGGNFRVSTADMTKEHFMSSRTTSEFVLYNKNSEKIPKFILVKNKKNRKPEFGVVIPKETDILTTASYFEKEIGIFSKSLDSLPSNDPTYSAAKPLKLNYVKLSCKGKCSKYWQIQIHDTISRKGFVVPLHTFHVKKNLTLTSETPLSLKRTRGSARVKKVFTMQIQPTKDPLEMYFTAWPYSTGVVSKVRFMNEQDQAVRIDDAVIASKANNASGENFFEVAVTYYKNKTEYFVHNRYKDLWTGFDYNLFAYLNTNSNMEKYTFSTYYFPPEKINNPPDMVHVLPDALQQATPVHVTFGDTYLHETNLILDSFKLFKKKSQFNINDQYTTNPNYPPSVILNGGKLKLFRQTNAKNDVACNSDDQICYFINDYKVVFPEKIYAKPTTAEIFSPDKVDFVVDVKALSRLHKKGPLWTVTNKKLLANMGLTIWGLSPKVKASLYGQGYTGFDYSVTSAFDRATVWNPGGSIWQSWLSGLKLWLYDEKFDKVRLLECNKTACKLDGKVIYQVESWQLRRCYRNNDCDSQHSCIKGTCVKKMPTCKVYKDAGAFNIHFYGLGLSDTELRAYVDEAYKKLMSTAPFNKPVYQNLFSVRYKVLGKAKFSTTKTVSSKFAVGYVPSVETDLWGIKHIWTWSQGLSLDRATVEKWEKVKFCNNKIPHITVVVDDKKGRAYAMRNFIYATAKLSGSGKRSTTFVHEIGHAFGKLGDEYYSVRTDKHGWKGVNCVSNVAEARSLWGDEIANQAVAGKWYGCAGDCDARCAKMLRPSQNSIMRYYVGTMGDKFNSVSLKKVEEKLRRASIIQTLPVTRTK